MSYSGGKGHLTPTSDNWYRELPGSFEETSHILSVHDGDLVSGEKATESYFKRNAGNYDLIHLALHGFADTVNMLNTKLRFRSDADSAQDGDLFAFELYNMPLKARFVALSACESGTGHYQRGEGSYSMARAFAITGVPTIVTSLCVVQDRTTQEIMTSMYERILDGHATDNALRMAKLDFIETRLSSNQAHPGNWSSFICIGAPDPIYANGSLWNSGIIVLMVLFILLSVVFWQKKSRS